MKTARLHLQTSLSWDSASANIHELSAGHHHQTLSHTAGDVSHWPRLIHIHLHTAVAALTSKALRWPRASRNAPSHTSSCRDRERGG